jgi:hypothetical protein
LCLKQPFCTSVATVNFNSAILINRLSSTAWSVNRRDDRPRGDDCSGEDRDGDGGGGSDNRGSHCRGGDCRQPAAAITWTTKARTALGEAILCHRPYAAPRGKIDDVYDAVHRDLVKALALPSTAVSPSHACIAEKFREIMRLFRKEDRHEAAGSGTAAECDAFSRTWQTIFDDMKEWEEEETKDARAAEEKKRKRLENAANGARMMEEILETKRQRKPPTTPSAAAATSSQPQAPASTPAVTAAAVVAAAATDEEVESETAAIELSKGNNPPQTQSTPPLSFARARDRAVSDSNSKQTPDWMALIQEDIAVRRKLAEDASKRADKELELQRMELEIKRQQVENERESLAIRKSELELIQQRH